MRRLLTLALTGALISLSGCGREGPREERETSTQSYDVSEPAADQAAPPPVAAPQTEESQRATMAGGPNVGPTAAPGVAFNYRYAFRLAAPRIAQVQEQHARACESLGVSRCRITGMRYRVVNDRDIEAMLAFKLDPAIARRFGQIGVNTVIQSEGMLIESEISGTDVGSTIRTTVRNIAELTAQLERIEARLRGRGLAAGERAQLEYEAEQLRQTIRANRESRQSQEESLATTPMAFHYGSGELVPGFDSRPSLRRAAERAADNFIDGVAILLIILVTLLPWLFLGLLGWLAFRFARRRWFAAPATTGAEPSPPGA